LRIIHNKGVRSIMFDFGHKKGVTRKGSGL
jgi:hypothetical protein